MIGWVEGGWQWWWGGGEGGGGGVWGGEGGGGGGGWGWGLRVAFCQGFARRYGPSVSHSVSLSD